MAANDQVLAALDAEIATLKADLEQAQTLRSWWAKRRADRAVGPGPAAATPRPSVEDPSLAEPVSQKTAKDWIMDTLSLGQELAVPEIRDAALDRGWTTTSKHPHQIIRNNVTELVKEGEVEKVGVKYRLPQAEMSSGPNRGQLHGGEP